MRKKSSIIIVFIIIIGISFSFLTSILITNIIDNNSGRTTYNIAGMRVDDFGYWLQDIDIETLRHSNYDLVIMDYSSDGSEEGKYTSSQVKYMKSSGAEHKLLFSYISIGEAEDYRFYWQNSWDTNPPIWLDGENLQWEGNYKVKFWYAEWQEIILDYMDKIIDAGFDGIYMDIIDAYEYYEKTVPNSDWLMIDFVVKISNYVKNRAGNNFLIFPQNGDELLLNSTYLNAIDGIGREDLFYSDNQKTSESWRNEGISNLNYALEDFKAVLIIDYPTSEANINDFYTSCLEMGYLPYAAERELNDLKDYGIYPPT